MEINYTRFVDGFVAHSHVPIEALFVGHTAEGLVHDVSYRIWRHVSFVGFWEARFLTSGQGAVGSLWHALLQHSYLRPRTAAVGYYPVVCCTTIIMFFS